jgi:MerR family redox-sensitive transcriptional activator SoxR
LASALRRPDLKAKPSSALEVKPLPRHTAPVTTELTIGELAERSGVRASALRFYEDRGLLRSERTPAGQRRYLRSAIRQVAFIVFAQNIGMSLEEVGRLLNRLPSKRAPQAADWSKLSAMWIARVDERIAELRRLRASLTECIGCGCLSLESCKLANPADRAGRLGPGPRYWINDADRPSS